MNVPQLRFNGFDGEWEEIKLGEFVEFKNGLNYLKSERGESVYTVGVKNFNHKKLRTITELETINLSSIPAKEFLLEKDDLLFVRSNGNKELVGRMMLIETVVENTYYSGFVIRGRIQNKNALEPLFLLSLEGKIKEALKTLTGGTNISNLSQSILKSISLNTPTIQEQKKVSSFIALLDQKIEKQKEKIDRLKQFKKGMMQKIFSQELRFKDEDSGEFLKWESTSLEKIAMIGKGFTPRTDEEDLWNGELPWLAISGMNQGKYISDASKAITTKAVENKRIVPEGTLIMSFKLSIGKLGITKIPIFTNEAICHFYWKQSDVDTEFMYYYLSTLDIKSFGSRAAKGVTLNNESLNAIVVKLPSYKEQKAIAEFLSKLDEKVELEKEKLVVLEEQKKGFMREMFV